MNNFICKNFSFELPNYLKGDLSLSEFEKFKIHLSTCIKCKKLLAQEKKFDQYLLEASMTEVNSSNPPESKMNLLYNSILNEIKTTPQENKKIKLNELTSDFNTQSKTKINRTIFISKPNIFALLPLLIFIVISVSMYIFKKPIHITQKNLSQRALYKYAKYRNPATLYGLNSNSDYYAYLNSFSKTIDTLDPKLQNTILFKIENINIQKRNLKKENKLSTNIKDEVTNDFF